MLRQIVFDTETTGINTLTERVVELGCVEIIDYVATGVTFQRYVNPEKLMEAEVIAVHGITNEFAMQQRPFADPSIVDEFLDFVGDATLVAHNAEFDRGFLNAEFARLGRPQFGKERFLDTLYIARKRHPGAPASLNALCRRYGVSLEDRAHHGALLDAHLLANVFRKMMLADAQGSLLEKARDLGTRALSGNLGPARIAGARPTPRPKMLTDEERAAHEAFIAQIGEAAVQRWAAAKNGKGDT